MPLGQWGSFIYPETCSDDIWSAGSTHSQTATVVRVAPEDKVDFRRVDAGITARMEIVVSAEDSGSSSCSLTNHLHEHVRLN